MDVDGYIMKQRSPQKEICSRPRSIILRAFPGIKEEVKMGVPWYECKFYIVALKDHVNLGFAVQGLSEGEAGSFEGKGRYMRHMKFFSEADMDEAKLTKHLRLVKRKAIGHMQDTATLNDKKLVCGHTTWIPRNSVEKPGTRSARPTSLLP